MSNSKRRYLFTTQQLFNATFIYFMEIHAVQNAFFRKYEHSMFLWTGLYFVVFLSMHHSSVKINLQSCNMWPVFHHDFKHFTFCLAPLRICLDSTFIVYLRKTSVVLSVWCYLLSHLSHALVSARSSDAKEKVTRKGANSIQTHAQCRQSQTFAYAVSIHSSVVEKHDRHKNKFNSHT